MGFGLAEHDIGQDLAGPGAHPRTTAAAVSSQLVSMPRMVRLLPGHGAVLYAEISQRPPSYAHSLSPGRWKTAKKSPRAWPKWAIRRCWRPAGAALPSMGLLEEAGARTGQCASCAGHQRQWHSRPGPAHGAARLFHFRGGPADHGRSTQERFHRGQKRRRRCQGAGGSRDPLGVAQRRAAACLRRGRAGHLGGKSQPARLQGAPLSALWHRAGETHLPRAQTRKARCRQGTLDAAMFFSPRSARIFGVLADGLPTECLAALCISPATAQALTSLSFARVAVAARPNQQAMLALDRIGVELLEKASAFSDMELGTWLVAGPAWEIIFARDCATMAQENANPHQSVAPCPGLPPSTPKPVLAGTPRPLQTSRMQHEVFANTEDFGGPDIVAGPAPESRPRHGRALRQLRAGQAL